MALILYLPPKSSLNISKPKIHKPNHVVLATAQKEFERPSHARFFSNILRKQRPNLNMVDFQNESVVKNSWIRSLRFRRRIMSLKIADEVIFLRFQGEGVF